MPLDCSGQERDGDNLGGHCLLVVFDGVSKDENVWKDIYPSIPEPLTIWPGVVDDVHNPTDALGYCMGPAREHQTRGEFNSCLVVYDNEQPVRHILFVARHFIEADRKVKRTVII